MPWPATNIVNRSAGEFIDDPDWDELVDALNFIANKPSVRARKTNQNINNATDTLLTWDAADDWDTDNMHDTATNNSRLIAKTAGKYRFKLQTDWDGNNVGQRSAFIGKNQAGAPPALGAARLASQTTNGAPDLECALTGEVQLAVNDYIEAFVFQTSGGTRVHGGTQRVTASFSMEWIGR